jgi:Domain of unknown function (DUF4168)
MTGSLIWSELLPRPFICHDHLTWLDAGREWFATPKGRAVCKHGGDRHEPIETTIIDAASCSHNSDSHVAFLRSHGERSNPIAVAVSLRADVENDTHQKLDAAAAALEQVASVKEDYQQRIKAADPSDRNRLAEEGHNAMVKAVTDRGLSVNEYSSILNLAENDPDVREGLLQRIRPPAEQ